jgi:hypothetical protein
MRGRAAVGCAAIWLAAQGAVAATSGSSVYTSIRPSDCWQPPLTVAQRFEDNDLGVQECGAPAGWRLFFVSSQSNSWFEVHGPDVVWSAERDVVYDDPIGLFPNVGSVPVVEWRRDGDGRIRALVFRVIAQDRHDPARRLSRLFVVRLAPTPPCLVGRVATNDAARALADTPARCQGRV